MNPQLADYDFVVLNTSAGKDSQTAMRFVMSQAEREAFPVSHIIAAHADLGRMEWPGTHALAQEQVAHYPGLRLWTVKRPQGDLLTQVEARRMWPSPMNRYCTSDQKRDQIAKLFTELAAELYNPDKSPSAPIRILNVMGMRAEESPARAKLAPFSTNTRATNSRRHVDTWLPIHELKLADVWADIKASGVPHHKAYDLGMPRLSCVFCIYSPPAALMLAGKHNPELLAEYVALEQRIGHTFRKDFPIAKVAQAIAAGEDWGPASDWVM